MCALLTLVVEVIDLCDLTDCVKVVCVMVLYNGGNIFGWKEHVFSSSYC